MSPAELALAAAVGFLIWLAVWKAIHRERQNDQREREREWPPR